MHLLSVCALLLGGFGPLAGQTRVVTWGQAPPNTPVFTDITAVSAGSGYALALRANGTVVAWGSGVATNVPPGLTDVVAISAGRNHALAVKRDGSVVGWGDNFFGKATVPAGVSDVVAVAAGYNRSIALRRNGTVTAWGDPRFCQNAPPLPSNLVATAVAAGWNTDLAVRASDGTVVVGCNDTNGSGAPPAGLSGVIAVAASSTNSFSFSLALRGDGVVFAFGPNQYGQTTVPPGLSGVTAIGAGFRHSLALKSDGTVVAWGENAVGQLNIPAGLTRVIAIAAGSGFNVALVDETPPLTTSCTATNGTAGVSYSGQLNASGGTPPYSWNPQPVSGSLPGGLALGANGLISGIPQTAGSSVFEARVTDAAQRTATVACAITVNPASPNCQSLAATPQPGVQGPAGGAGTLTIATTCNWTVSTDTPWITVIGPTSGTGNAVVNYQVASYPNSSVPRTGTILVNQTPVQILQNPGTCNSLLSENSRSVPAAGATFSVSVFSAPASCAWSAQSNASWIRILNGADSTSGNEVRLQVDLHTGTTPRAGTVTIAGRTFTVNQALGAGCEPQLVPGAVRVAAAGTPLVNVQVLTGCAYTARSDAAWIRVVSGGSGVSSGLLGLEVLGNLAAVPRRGTVTVGTRVLVVEQAAGGCGEVSLSTASISAVATGGTYRVNVKVPPGCGAPTLASGVPWITAVVAGNLVTLTVSPNGTAASRSGVVTVNSSYSVRVTQAAAAAFSCTASATPIDVREEGTTELTGRYTLTCSGQSSQAIRADVLLKLNTGYAAASDTLLVLDDGQPVTVGVNAYRGTGTLQHGIRFSRVPIAVAGLNPQRRWQVFNLRANASRVASISAAASMRGIPVTNAEQVVAHSRDSVRGTIGGSGLAVTATFVELMANALKTQAEEGGLVVNGSIGLASTGTRLVMLLRLPVGVYAIAQQSTGARLIGVTDSPLSTGLYQRQLVWEVTAPSPSLIDSITVSALLGGFLLPDAPGQIRATGRAVLGPFEGSGVPRFINPLLVGVSRNLRITQQLKAVPAVNGAAPDRRSPTGNRSVELAVTTTNDETSAMAEEVVIRGNLPSGVRFTSCDIEGGDPANCSIGEGTFSAAVPKLDAGEANRVRLIGLLEDVDGSLVNVDVSAASGISVAEDSAEQCLAGISALPQPLAAGTSGTFDVYACEAWTLTSDVPWIRFTPSSGTGNTTVQYTVDANIAGTARAGKVSYPGGGSLTVTQLPPAAGGVQTAGLRFVPVEPCRLIETRAEYNFQGRTGAFGPPGLLKDEVRTLVAPSSNVCTIPATAKAYVLNVTAIPKDGKAVERVTVWPAGEPRPAAVRTVSSADGQTVANTAIVKANGSAFSVYASDAADLIVDITGYFTDPGGENLVFYPLTPCRVTDTRALYRPEAGPFGPPSMVGRQTRRFVVPQTPYCQVPATARAYSVTLTVAPPGPLAYLTMWQAGGGQPNVSSINSFVGRTLANNVIVPAGTGGALDVFVFDNTDLLIDINGYFAPDDGQRGLYYFPQSPCVALDTTVGGVRLSDEETRTIPLVASSCGIPATAKGYVLNATSIPDGRDMPFLTMWPTGQARPIASVSNAFEGQVVTNSSLVPAGANGSVDVFAFRRTHVVVDVSGYFNRPGQ